eukprot:7920688-Pyramimonas_sp.AAC.1
MHETKLARVKRCPPSNGLFPGQNGINAELPQNGADNPIPPTNYPTPQTRAIPERQLAGSDFRAW